MTTTAQSELVRKMDNPITGGVVQVPSEDDKRLAAKARARIATLLTEIHAGERALSSNYARLGAALLEVRQNKYWIGWGFRSFGSYIADIEKQYNRGRSQLYQFISISEVLLPQLGEGTLAEIGASKAGELKFFSKESQRRVPQELLDLAKDPNKTAAQLHDAVMQELHHPGEEKGRWREWGGFFSTDDEWAEIQDAVKAAKQVDPPVPHDVAEHAQRLEVMLRFAREFRSSYPN